MPIAPEEDIVRAICTEKWDGTRAAPSLFTGRDVSVSRLAVIPLADHWDMFRMRFENPPERRLERIGEINVGHLQQIGRDSAQRTDLTVEPKPEDWNRAHAEIPQKITRGLANKKLSMRSSFTRHRDGDRERDRRRGEIIDVFSAAGLKQPDISILSDQFLAEVRGLKYKNVAAELLASC